MSDGGCMTPPPDSAAVDAARGADALLAEVEAQLLRDRLPLRFEQAVQLVELDARHTPALVGLAHRVRLAYCGPDVELESLLSAKTGGRSEDCAFFLPSARFPSPARMHPMMDIALVTAAIRRSQADIASQ